MTNVKKTQTRLPRRGLLAAATAFLATMAGKLTVQPVEAGTDGDLILGNTGQITGPSTGINCTGANQIALGGRCIAGVAGWGLLGEGSGIGVIGVHTGANLGSGVYGEANGTQMQGVYGLNVSGTGVLGVSASDTGVRGEIRQSSSSNAIAVYALNNSTYAGPAPGAGGFGIYGSSARGHGLVGATGTAGGAAVVGATNGVPGAYAAAFYGPVVIGGALTVVGGPKSAAVPFPDGSHRVLYCEEAPESWFADYGKAKVVDGRGEVTIDPEFASAADLSDYHVFLTPYGDTNGLHVTKRTASGFVVAEHRGGRSCLDFSWRIVAKRKDIAAPRLAKIDIPRQPALPTLAAASETPGPMLESKKNIFDKADSERPRQR